MASELDEIVARLGELQQGLRKVEDRLATIEAELGMVPALRGAREDGSPESAAATALATNGEAVRTAAYLGRSLLILGGAYFIRAASESGLLALPVGVLLATLYAVLWIGLAHRAARAGRRTSSLFFAGAAAAVVFPLIWEGCVRFAVLTPTVAALLLCLVSSALLAVAWRHDLPLAAWIGVLGGGGTAVALFFTARAFEAPAVVLVFLGGAAYWICLHRPWPVLTGWSALLADFGVFVLGTAALSPGAHVDPHVTIAVQLLLFVLYVGSFLAASLALGRRSGVFEGLQLALVTVIGFGGAAWIASTLGGRAVLLVSLASLVAALVGYGVVLSYRTWIELHPRSYFFFASLVLAVAATGAGLLPGASALAWAILALLAAAIASRWAGATLGLHALAYVLLAALGGGLLFSAIRDLFAPFGEALAPFTAIDGAVLGAALLCALLPVAADDAPWRGWPRFGKPAVVAIVLLGLGALTVSQLQTLTEISGAINGGRLATLRTVTLAALTLLAAAASRLRPLRSATWLVYPTLALGGTKLVLEDFFQSRPGELGIALAVYASALILAPRLRATGERASRQAAARRPLGETERGLGPGPDCSDGVLGED